jgi:hypothetical protein
MKTLSNDFWRDWQTEQERFWQAHNGREDRRLGPAFPGPEMARTWRTFFHDFMGVWP